MNIFVESLARTTVYEYKKLIMFNYITLNKQELSKRINLLSVITDSIICDIKYSLPLFKQKMFFKVNS